MTKLIVDLQTETILGIDHCVILDIEKLSAEDQATLAECDEDMGFDDDVVCEIAARNGIKLTELGASTGWGDLQYRNAVAYSPLSMKDEALVYTESGMYEEDEKEFEALMWVRRASTEELDELSDFIMNDDAVWNGYRSNFVDNLVHFYNIMQKKEEGK